MGYTTATGSARSRRKRVAPNSLGAGRALVIQTVLSGAKYHALLAESEGRTSSDEMGRAGVVVVVCPTAHSGVEGSYT